MSDSVEPTPLYDAVGGMPFFTELVDRFYDGVVTDPELLARYPTPEDLSDARRHLALFLAQYFGGPAEYQVERGAPRLRMRHFEFDVDTDMRDRWLTHMRAAVKQMNPPEVIREPLVAYFEMAAEALRIRD